MVSVKASFIEAIHNQDVATTRQWDLCIMLSDLEPSCSLVVICKSHMKVHLVVVVIKKFKNRKTVLKSIKKISTPGRSLE